VKRLHIFGAGGQAREVADIADSLGYAPVLLIRDDSGGNVGWPVLDEAEATGLTDEEFAIGVGDNDARARIAERYSHLQFPNLIHPDSSIGRTARALLAARRGVVIQAGVRLTSDVAVGDFCNLNLNATVSHDCRLEDFVTVSPGASVAGHVHVGRKVWIGIGACISNGSTERPLAIGERAVIGAGAVVIRDCEEGGVYAGVPARRLR